MAENKIKTNKRKKIKIEFSAELRHNKCGAKT